MLIAIQARWCVSVWLFQDVDLDPFRLGISECPGSDSLVVFDSRRALSFRPPSADRIIHAI
jgi:hypothetical protein